MFIGTKQVKTTEKTEDKTPGGIELWKVTFEDGTIEMYSELMYQKVISEEVCTLEQLLDKRCTPVVEIMLAVLREWGVKLGELGYISAYLNKSLEFNKNSAIQELWSQWMPRPLSLDDVDMVTVDRVLKSRKETIDDVIGNTK